MRILIALTYYRPHYSGLTIYAERLAKALAAAGHTVTVLTSQYDPDLPRRARESGVDVVRLPVWARISKGVVMPSIVLWAWRLVGQADVINLHVPQLDAALIAVFGRLFGKTVVLTYHCDLRLPRGLIHSIANWVSNVANHIAARAAHTIVTNTWDYAENSPFLHRYLGKVSVIPPPVELPHITSEDLEAFRRKAHLHADHRIIGMAARLATEKGVEFLVEALPEILKKFPTARVLFVGQYEDVLGEETYAQKLVPLISRLGEHWSFMGILSPKEFVSFLHLSDVTVLPSTNSTESFGMVQVESMTCGTPVVASNLPGVRQPVTMTGMGKVVPADDAPALAQAIIDVLDTPKELWGDPKSIAQMFSPGVVAQAYLDLFAETAERQKSEQSSQVSDADTP